ncbi:MAG TPA: MFS transporter [Thermosulfidibacter takaii]|uniref:MFS transporter n=1 Tax=Thermosulfidibacter takaii TaxID=412593 RepID=A0A7C0Y986_9BACT|nr:MFS transporter [Thermosulfidibacter takaii]
MELGNKRAVFGWAMYDWANSAFATAVMAGFFPIFFKQFWSAGVDASVSTARLGVANSVAGVAVALSAPLLGAIADKGGVRKRFLLFFAYMGAVMTASLYIVSQGHWPWAVALYVLATVGFSGGNIFYDALLTEVASEEKMHFVSALGFSLGYLGGGLLFALDVGMVLSPGTFGFADATEALRFAFLSVGVWWVVFSLPLLLFVKEERAVGEPGVKMVRAGIAQLVETFRKARSLKTLFLFLLAYWLYIDGVNTVVRMAVDYGLSLGFRFQDMILALLITQFVGFPSTIGFGYFGEKVGAKGAILFAIGVYLVLSLWGAFIRSKWEFYLVALVIGLVQGGLQALSRSYYARLIPLDKSAEYFGFYNMVGKFAAVLGPAMVGAVALLVRSMGFSSQVASRASIAFLSLFFIVGGALFALVKPAQSSAES